jgi:hypothetical protein
MWDLPLPHRQRRHVGPTPAMSARRFQTVPVLPERKNLTTSAHLHSHDSSGAQPKRKAGAAACRRAFWFAPACRHAQRAPSPAVCPSRPHPLASRFRSMAAGFQNHTHRSCAASGPVPAPDRAPPRLRLTLPLSFPGSLMVPPVPLLHDRIWWCRLRALMVISVGSASSLSLSPSPPLCPPTSLSLWYKP